MPKMAPTMSAVFNLFLDEDCREPEAPVDVDGDMLVDDSLTCLQTNPLISQIIRK